MNPYPFQPGTQQRIQRAIDTAAWSAQEAQRTRDEPGMVYQPLVWSEFAVQSVHDNHLVCLAYDGTSTYGQPINVAKDPELRRSHYHGKTIDNLSYDYTGVQARTVTNTLLSASKDQVIIPKYHVPADGPAGFPGSIITAAPIATTVDGAGLCQWREITQRAFANVEQAS